MMTFCGRRQERCLILTGSTARQMTYVSKRFMRTFDMTYHEQSSDSLHYSAIFFLLSFVQCS